MKGSTKISLISLGCPKNLVDSETILGKAGLEGFSITPSPADADVIVINTCGFIDAARDESIDTILEACKLKRKSPTPKKVVVAGCLGQRYGADLRERIPDIDAIVGLGQYDAFGATLRELIDGGGAAQIRLGDPNFACNAEVGRLRLTPAHYAYLRISEGCDNPCTFCAIPLIRGGFRSKPLPQVVEEARELAESGARELVIISQDTTSYGIDLYGDYKLPELLRSVAEVPGVEWIRLLYVYPACFSDAMIDAVASIPQVVKYVDIPLQHISETMLRRMGRRLGRQGTVRLLERMRERIPGLTLRTTFIVGFPGEDDEEFGILRDFVRDFRFERLGVFAYSREEGTPAFRIKESVPKEIAEARVEELMLTQQEVAFAQNRSRVGEPSRVILDRPDDGEWVARSAAEAPDIDPVIFVREPRRSFRELPVAGGRARSARPPQGASPEATRGGAPWAAGEFLDVTIVETRDYDLAAEERTSSCC